MLKLLKSYAFWTYERGSIHYDVMVTAILIFMFVTPHFVNFGDRPVETVALRSSEVLVKENGPYRFIYQIRADNLGGFETDRQRDTAILRAVEPISGEVTLERVVPLLDASKHVVAYDAYIKR
jgi:hypothetical protein